MHAHGQNACKQGPYQSTAKMSMVWQMLNNTSGTTKYSIMEKNVTTAKRVITLPNVAERKPSKRVHMVE